MKLIDGRNQEVEEKKVGKKWIRRILAITVFGIMFVPMLYSVIYLGSIWDAYGSIDSVPIAFVNMDKAVTVDGTEYAVGRELEENLNGSDTVAWKFVGYDQAMEGVDGTGYYAAVIIPEDF